MASTYWYSAERKTTIWYWLNNFFERKNKKKFAKNLEDKQNIHIFAPLFKRKFQCLDYGVMVAQQVLVLFVQVRILVVQQLKL